MKYFTKEVRIALVAIVGLVLLYFGMNFLKGQSLFASDNIYIVEFDNAEGLSGAAPIYADGYRIGTVLDTKYDYQRHVIIARADVDKALHLPVGTTAEISTDLMGNSRVNLILAGTPDNLLKPGDIIKGAVSEGAMGQVKAMIPAIEQMLPKLDSILASVNMLLADPALANTLHNAQKITDNLTVSTNELNKMLMCDDPVCAMRLLVDIGAMRYVIPELYDTVDVLQNEYHENDVWEHTLNVLNLVAKRPFYGVAELEVRMAALLHDIGKPHVKSVDDKGRVHFYGHELAGADIAEIILRRLKYSNHFIERVKFLIENHMKTKQWGDTCEHMKDKTLRKLQHQCGYARFFELMTLIDADNKSHAIDHCLPNQVYMINKYTNRMVDDKTDMFDYELPINGDDVMFIKGIEPGRDVKDCLEYAMKLAYNNPKITRTELLKHIKGYKL